MTKTAGTKSLQRVGGCCEPMTILPNAYHFRAGNPKFFEAFPVYLRRYGKGLV